MSVCRKLAAADISISVAQTLSFVTTSNSRSFASCHSLWGQFISGSKYFLTPAVIVVKLAVCLCCVQVRWVSLDRSVQTARPARPDLEDRPEPLASAARVVRRAAPAGLVLVAIPGRPERQAALDSPALPAPSVLLASQAPQAHSDNQVTAPDT